MTRRLAAALLLAAMASPASAAWPSGGGGSCALVCGHADGADCCTGSESSDRASIRRCPREMPAFSFLGTVPFLPTRPVRLLPPGIVGRPAPQPVAALLPLPARGIDHVPRLLG